MASPGQATKLFRRLKQLWWDGGGGQQKTLSLLQVYLMTEREKYSGLLRGFYCRAPRKQNQNVNEEKKRLKLPRSTDIKLKRQFFHYYINIFFTLSLGEMTKAY